MHKIVLSLAVLGLTATTAFAQTPTTFADVDVDANGELSLVELQAAWPDMTAVEFQGADTDGSGGLAAPELNAVQDAAAPAAPAPEPAPETPLPLAP